MTTPTTTDGEVDYLILGAGVTGLAAASVLGERAVVLEAADRPGGLVRTECIDGFWFDRVLHLLHLSDARVESAVRALLGDVLGPCPPVAWVETVAGTTRYPFQMHLAPLPRDEVVRCLSDLAETTFRPHPARADDFETHLLHTFGRRMCELFLWPYNRKLWKRPLTSLAATGFTWTIAPPAFPQVVQGALDLDATYRPYNANGWYPRPPAAAPWRGMEVLSRALAAQVSDLRCGHRVIAIDPQTRTVTAQHGERRVRLGFRKACLSTLPLPATIATCAHVPATLATACAGLLRNRVVTVMLGVKGPRPEGSGLWRYYADEQLCFHRLVFLHEFDPLMAPADGWGLLAEIAEPAEWPLDVDGLVRRTQEEVERLGIVSRGSRVVVATHRVTDPAYVVFTPDSSATVDAARQYLAARDITTLGRYGRWEYSSIAQNMRDGYAWAQDAIATATCAS